MHFNYILKEIRNRYIPLAPSILELLNPDINLAREIFESQVKIAVKEFTKYCPLVRSKSVTQTPYTFVDNFDGFIKGNIHSNNIELIPQGIANIQYNLLARSSVRSNYIYDIGNATLIHGVGLVTYFTHYPIFSELAEDGRFSDLSAIYMIGEDTSEGNMLLDQIAYILIKSIDSARQLVSPQFSTQFFDFSNVLSELSYTIAENNRVSSSIYNIWSPTGIGI